MFTEYWGLREKPFLNTPDPKFFFPLPAYRDALTRLSYAVEEQMGAAMLTGVFGCGKTLLSKALAERLNKTGHYKVAFISNPMLDEVEFLRAVAYSLGVPNLPAQRSEVLTDRLLQSIEEALSDNLKDGKDSVLIVDEAHLIQDKVILEQLRLLLNFQLPNRFLLSLVLLGQPELRSRVENIKQLSQRIPVRCHLDRLDKEDTFGYIRHRLKVAGAEKELFKQDAMEMLHRHSGGIPRRINQICEMCLLNGFLKRAEIVDTALVQESLNYLDMGEETPAENKEPPPLTWFPAAPDALTAERESAASSAQKESVKIEEEDAKRLYVQMAAITKEVVRRATSGEKIAFGDINSLLARVIESLSRNDSLIQVMNQNVEYEYFINHPVNGAILAVKIGIELERTKETLLELGMAAWMRDIGMIELEELSRKPARLDDGEIRIIFTHPKRSREMLMPFVEIDKKILDIIGKHHERLNGEGYPAGLKGDEVDESTQIVGIADTYEALVHPRQWRKAYLPDEALNLILKMGGTLFSHEVIKVLIKSITFYPAGTLVSLSTNETAMVLKINKAFPMRPLIEVILDATGERLGTPKRIDLVNEPFITIKRSLGLTPQP